jgi:hypothetical protein
VVRAPKNLAKSAAQAGRPQSGDVPRGALEACPGSISPLSTAEGAIIRPPTDKLPRPPSQSSGGVRDGLSGFDLDRLFLSGRGGPRCSSLVLTGPMFEPVIEEGEWHNDPVLWSRQDPKSR